MVVYQIERSKIFRKNTYQIASVYIFFVHFLNSFRIGKLEGTENNFLFKGSLMKRYFLGTVLEAQKNFSLIFLQ